jgi:hypothetical protein
MTIDRRRPYGALDEGRLLRFEASLPAPLPSDYRRFLVGYNGAKAADCPSFEEIPGRTEVNALFGLHDGPRYLRLDAMREALADRIPASLLVFASDPFGNYFGLDLREPRRGAVLFLGHEALPVERRTLLAVAPSFTALLERIGPELRQRDPPTSVHEAVVQGDAEALRALLRGTNNAAGLVHPAVLTGYPEILRLVLEHGGDANERGGIGNETPLFVAARADRPDLARLLLAYGAEPNARCDAGGTAMEMATWHPEVIEVLVRAGATPTTPLLRELVREILGDGPAGAG